MCSFVSLSNQTTKNVYRIGSRIVQNLHRPFHLNHFVLNKSLLRVLCGYGYAFSFCVKSPNLRIDLRYKYMEVDRN